MIRIDTRHHLRDLSARPQDRLDGPDLEPIRRDFGPADLRAVTSTAGVDATVQVPADIASYGRVVEAAEQLTAGLTGAEQALVFGGTAARVYRLGNG